jgi:cell division protein FtsL
MNKTLKYFLGLILAIIVIYFIMTIISQQKSLSAYNRELRDYNQKLEDAKEERKELEDTQNNLNSPEFIEEIARDKLDMYLPNEKIYIDISK